MRQFMAYGKLTRWNEYYGKVVLNTLLGFFLVQIEFRPGLILLLANLTSAAFAFMINDIEDADDDKEDLQKRHRNPVSAGLLKRNNAQIVTYFMAFLSLLLYATFNRWVFVLGFTGLFLGFLYSFKRVRLKSKPLIDITSHGFFMALVYFLCAIYVSDELPSIFSILWLGIPIYLMSVIGDINNEIRDFKSDTKAGLKNTASIVNIEHLKRLVNYPSMVLIILILTYLIINSGIYTIIFIVVCTSIIAIHYKYKFMKNGRNIYSYPYAQQLFVVLALSLFAKPIWDKISFLTNLLR